MRGYAFSLIVRSPFDANTFGRRLAALWQVAEEAIHLTIRVPPAVGGRRRLAQVQYLNVTAVVPVDNEQTANAIEASASLLNVSIVAVGGMQQIRALCLPPVSSSATPAEPPLLLPLVFSGFIALLGWLLACALLAARCRTRLKTRDSGTAQRPISPAFDGAFVGEVQRPIQAPAQSEVAAEGALALAIPIPATQPSANEWVERNLRKRIEVQEMEKHELILALREVERESRRRVSELQHEKQAMIDQLEMSKTEEDKARAEHRTFSSRAIIAITNGQRELQAAQQQLADLQQMGEHKDQELRETRARLQQMSEKVVQLLEQEPRVERETIETVRETKTEVVVEVEVPAESKPHESVAVQTEAVHISNGARMVDKSTQKTDGATTSAVRVQRSKKTPHDASGDITEQQDAAARLIQTTAKSKGPKTAKTSTTLTNSTQVKTTSRRDGRAIASLGPPKLKLQLLGAGDEGKQAAHEKAEQVEEAAAEAEWDSTHLEALSQLEDAAPPTASRSARSEGGAAKLENVVDDAHGMPSPSLRDSERFPSSEIASVIAQLQSTTEQRATARADDAKDQVPMFAPSEMIPLRWTPTSPAEGAVYIVLAENLRCRKDGREFDIARNRIVTIQDSIGGDREDDHRVICALRAEATTDAARRAFEEVVGSIHFGLWSIVMSRPVAGSDPHGLSLQLASTVSSARMPTGHDLERFATLNDASGYSASDFPARLVNGESINAGVLQPLLGPKKSTGAAGRSKAAVRAGNSKQERASGKQERPSPPQASSPKTKPASMKSTPKLPSIKPSPPRVAARPSGSAAGTSRK